jgi:predicted membrane-bound spermidine synthase
MRPPGSYKIASKSRAFEALLHPHMRSARRARRIIDSLRNEILEGGDGLRIRRVFTSPREVFRLEIELPELGYQRTTLLDREALDELLAADDVRALVRQRLRLS